MNFFVRKYYQLLSKYYKRKANKHVEFLKAKYYLKNKKPLNLENPTDFSEKIHWLKLYDYDESYKKYIDKYEVREHIESTIGAKYLNELIDVYDNVEDIDFDSLPQKFVLKGTHGSGYNVIVKDKSALDWPKAKQKLQQFLSTNYYEKYKETVYKSITPRIVAEKYLDQLDSDHIIDYKFMCFHGEPHYIHVKTYEDDRIKEAYYDMNWQKQIPETIGENHLKQDIPKPVTFDEMRDIAIRLSKGFTFVRVDLYEIGDNVYFGELTFIHKGGMIRNYVEPLNKIMGDLIHLPKEKKNLHSIA